MSAQQTTDLKNKAQLPEKYVYFFAAGESEGSAKMKDVLGGKGANLAEMTAIGLPVPPGFTIATSICQVFYDNACMAQRMPFIEANVVYARAIGAARSGNVASARADVERLGVLGEASAKEAKFAFFVKQVELQRKAGQGWLLHAEHREIESLAAMRAAVELEDAIGKHPVTPGARRWCGSACRPRRSRAGRCRSCRLMGRM